jgi:hypothetical protein
MPSPWRLPDLALDKASCIAKIGNNCTGTGMKTPEDETTCETYDETCKRRGNNLALGCMRCTPSRNLNISVNEWPQIFLRSIRGQFHEPKAQGINE